MQSTATRPKVQRPRTLAGLVRPAPTLRELAKAAGVSESLIYKVSSGVKKPNAAIRRAVEEVYGVPARLLFGDEVARPWGLK